MNYTRAIDNVEDMFNLDIEDTFAHEDGVQFPVANSMASSSRALDKGKGVSAPLDIGPSSSTNNMHDVFDDVASTSQSSPTRNYSLPFRHPSQPLDHDKGKGRELPPSLPPFSFSPPEFGYGRVDWPSASSPGPSSYGSPPNAFTHAPEHSPLVLNAHPSHMRSGDEHAATSSPACGADAARSAEVGPSSCFTPWCAELQTIPSVPNLLSDIDASTVVDHSRPHRSQSLPILCCPLDIVPSASLDQLISIRIIFRNYFDEALPKELRLQILSDLVASHERDHAQSVADGEWTSLKAAQDDNKWVGADRGFRELVRFSRISKAWRNLIFDGQLWSTLDLSPFPSIPTRLVLHFAAKAGAFVKRLDLSGHALLTSTTLLSIIDDICSRPALLSQTQLTHVNLKGCSSLTNRALHHLIMRCPALESICLGGLNAVTNGTCSLFGVHCLDLAILDVSRCGNMDAEGIRAMAAAAILRGEHLSLRELRLSGLKGVNDVMMRTLGRAAPNLEVLDLSYARGLHNSALDVFVSCAEHDESVDGLETVVLTSSEAGREIASLRKYRRRVTRMRHLSLTGCSLLTDIACSNLAHSMPRLEFLEMAGIGDELRDEGLVRLLNTTPLIRRLDLEDASEITDTLLACLTPAPITDDSKRRPLQLGEALEHLTVSYASALTDDALLSLIRGCPKMRTLEADNTAMSGVVLKEFVHLSKKRNALDARIVAVDCRAIEAGTIKELSPSIRPRLGWRSYDARKLHFLDGRDEEGLKVGQDELDATRVAVKTFHSWQTVDLVRAAREKKRKRSSSAQRRAEDGVDGDYLVAGRASRWWITGGRRSSTPTTPTGGIGQAPQDGCTIM